MWGYLITAVDVDVDAVITSEAALTAIRLIGTSSLIRHSKAITGTYSSGLMDRQRQRQQQQHFKR